MDETKETAVAMTAEELVGYIKKAGKAQSIKEFECPYVPGFYVSLRYTSKFVFSQLREAAKEMRPDPKTRKNEEQLNTAKLRDEYARRIIVSGRGLTILGLKRLLPGLEIPAGHKIDEGIEFTPQIARALLGDEETGSLEFEGWIVDTSSDPANYAEIAALKRKEYENLA